MVRARKALTVIELLVNAVIALDGMITQQNGVDQIRCAKVVRSVYVWWIVCGLSALSATTHRVLAFLTVFDKGDSDQRVLHELLVAQHGVHDIF